MQSHADDQTTANLRWETNEFNSRTWSPIRRAAKKSTAIASWGSNEDETPPSAQRQVVSTSTSENSQSELLRPSVRRGTKRPAATSTFNKSENERPQPPLRQEMRGADVAPVSEDEEDESPRPPKKRSIRKTALADGLMYENNKNGKPRLSNKYRQPRRDVSKHQEQVPSDTIIPETDYEDESHEPSRGSRRNRFDPTSIPNDQFIVLLDDVVIKPENDTHHNNVPGPTREDSGISRGATNGSVSMAADNSDPADSDQDDVTQDGPAAPISESMRSKLDLTRKLMADKRAEYRNKEWFNGWVLAPAFTKEYWERCVETVIAGGYAPLPLIMCDSEAQDLKSITLAKALNRLPPGRATFGKLGQDTASMKSWVHHSHHCHNAACRLPPHIRKEKGFLNILRELCRDIKRWLRDGGAIPLFCKEHAEYGPCITGCLALTRVEKVISQWMAANDFANLKEVPGWKLGDMASLDDDIISTQLCAYLAEEADDNIFLHPVSKHKLSILCSHAVHDPDTALSVASESFRIDKVMMDVARMRQNRLQGQPNQFTGDEERQIYDEKVRLQRFSIKQLEHRKEGQDIMRHNREAVNWNRSDGGGLYCRLCYTRYHELSIDKWPTISKTDVFTRSPLFYVKHVTTHVDFDEAVRCEELEAMTKQSKLFGS